MQLEKNCAAICGNLLYICILQNRNSFIWRLCNIQHASR